MGVGLRGRQKLAGSAAVTFDVSDPDFFFFFYKNMLVKTGGGRGALIIVSQ